MVQILSKAIAKSTFDPVVSHSDRVNKAPPDSQTSPSIVASEDQCGENSKKPQKIHRRRTAPVYYVPLLILQ